VAIKSDAQRRAVAKYNAGNYTQIQIRVKKGYREEIQAAAARAGLSVNAFIIQAIEKAIEEG
jgi:predicted HicB family RNase H-like nuclease